MASRCGADRDLTSSNYLIKEEYLLYNTLD